MGDMVKGNIAMAEAAIRAACICMQVIRLHPRQKLWSICPGVTRSRADNTSRQKVNWVLCTWFTAQHLLVPEFLQHLRSRHFIKAGRRQLHASSRLSLRNDFRLPLW